jgi:hypothetical protein
MSPGSAAEWAAGQASAPPGAADDGSLCSSHVWSSMLSASEAGHCSDPRAGEETEGWEDDEIVARILCRLGQLKQRGCEQPECVVLASRLDVDLDTALALIGRGCSPPLAVGILA